MQCAALSGRWNGPLALLLAVVILCAFTNVNAIQFTAESAGAMATHIAQSIEQYGCTHARMGRTASCSTGQVDDVMTRLSSDGVHSITQVTPLEVISRMTQSLNATLIAPLLRRLEMIAESARPALVSGTPLWDMKDNFGDRNGLTSVNCSDTVVPWQHDPLRHPSLVHHSVVGFHSPPGAWAINTTEAAKHTARELDAQLASVNLTALPERWAYAINMRDGGARMYPARHISQDQDVRSISALWANAATRRIVLLLDSSSVPSFRDKGAANVPDESAIHAATAILDTLKNDDQFIVYVLRGGGFEAPPCLPTAFSSHSQTSGNTSASMSNVLLEASSRNIQITKDWLSTINFGEVVDAGSSLQAAVRVATFGQDSSCQRHVVLVTSGAYASAWKVNTTLQREVANFAVNISIVTAGYRQIFGNDCQKCKQIACDHFGTYMDVNTNHSIAGAFDAATVLRMPSLGAGSSYMHMSGEGCLATGIGHTALDCSPVAVMPIMAQSEELLENRPAQSSSTGVSMQIGIVAIELQPAALQQILLDALHESENFLAGGILVGSHAYFVGEDRTLLGSAEGASWWALESSWSAYSGEAVPRCTSDTCGRTKHAGVDGMLPRTKAAEHTTILHRGGTLRDSLPWLDSASIDTLFASEEAVCISVATDGDGIFLGRITVCAQSLPNIKVRILLVLPGVPNSNTGQLTGIKSSGIVRGSFASLTSSWHDVHSLEGVTLSNRTFDAVAHLLGVPELCHVQSTHLAKDLSVLGRISHVADRWGLHMPPSAFARPEVAVTEKISKSQGQALWEYLESRDPSLKTMLPHGGTVQRVLRDVDLLSHFASQVAPSSSFLIDHGLATHIVAKDGSSVHFPGISLPASFDATISQWFQKTITWHTKARSSAHAFYLSLPSAALSSTSLTKSQNGSLSDYTTTGHPPVITLGRSVHFAGLSSSESSAQTLWGAAGVEVSMPILSNMIDQSLKKTFSVENLACAGSDLECYLVNEHLQVLWSNHLRVPSVAVAAMQSAWREQPGGSLDVQGVLSLNMHLIDYAPDAVQALLSKGIVQLSNGTGHAAEEASSFSQGGVILSSTSYSFVDMTANLPVALSLPSAQTLLYAAAVPATNAVLLVKQKHGSVRSQPTTDASLADSACEAQAPIGCSVLNPICQSLPSSGLRIKLDTACFEQNSNLVHKGDLLALAQTPLSQNSGSGICKLKGMARQHWEQALIVLAKNTTNSGVQIYDCKPEPFPVLMVSLVGIAAALVIALLLFIWRRRRRKLQEMAAKDRQRHAKVNNGNDDAEGKSQNGQAAGQYLSEVLHLPKDQLPSLHVIRRHLSSLAGSNIQDEDKMWAYLSNALQYAVSFEEMETVINESLLPAIKIFGNNCRNLLLLNQSMHAFLSSKSGALSRDIESMVSRMVATESLAAEIERLRLQLPILKQKTDLLNVSLTSFGRDGNSDFYGQYHEEIARAQADISDVEGLVAAIREGSSREGPSSLVSNAVAQADESARNAHRATEEEIERKLQSFQDAMEETKVDEEAKVESKVSETAEATEESTASVVSMNALSLPAGAAAWSGPPLRLPMSGKLEQEGQLARRLYLQRLAQQQTQSDSANADAANVNAKTSRRQLPDDWIQQALRLHTAGGDELPPRAPDKLSSPSRQEAEPKTLMQLYGEAIADDLGSDISDSSLPLLSPMVSARFLASQNSGREAQGGVNEGAGVGVQLADHVESREVKSEGGEDEPCLSAASSSVVVSDSAGTGTVPDLLEVFDSIVGSTLPTVPEEEADVGPENNMDSGLSPAEVTAALKHEMLGFGSAVTTGKLSANDEEQMQSMFYSPRDTETTVDRGFSDNHMRDWRLSERIEDAQGSTERSLVFPEASGRSADRSIGAEQLAYPADYVEDDDDSMMM